MQKSIGFVVGVLLASVVATVIISRERVENRRLQSVLESLRTERDRFANMPARNEPLSNLVEVVDRPAAPSALPSLELLRLRGEVGRLRRELEKAQFEKSRELESVYQKEETTASFSNPLAVTEIDLNKLINIPGVATTNDVLAELERLGAQLVAQEQGFIEAGISIPTTNSDLSPSVMMEFYFDDDRLSSKKFYRLPNGR
jgi:hypothetical protein